MAKNDLLNTPFLKRLTALTREVYRTKGREQEFGLLDPQEGYAISVLLAAGEVMSACNSLEMVPVFLSSYRSTPSTRKATITRLDHIFYHLENYFIRGVSVFDRSLILTNEVFRLGNESENCNSKTILENRYVFSSPVKDVLKKLERHVQPLRRTRNVVIHRRRYWSDDSRTLELMYLLNEDEPGSVPQSTVKEWTDRFVKGKIKEAEEFNKLLKTTTQYLFQLLLPEFEEKFVTLQASKLPSRESDST